MSTTFLTELFRQLSGQWKLHRDLHDSSSSTQPPFESICQGFAVFTSRPPSTVDNSQTNTAPHHYPHPHAEPLEPEVEVEEHLYHESGTFHPMNSSSSNHPLPFSRKYIWRLTHPTSGHDSEAKPAVVSLYFTKPGTEELDYLFHELDFESAYESDPQAPPSDRKLSLSLTASGGHLCVQDMYNTEYSFLLEHGRLKEWRTRHTVVGPGKEQIITTIFAREQG